MCPEGSTGFVEDLERSALLGNEAVHRVRNLLAVIRSVLSRTIGTATSPQEAIYHFEGRLDALSRYQAGSALAPAGSIGIETMLRDELLVVGADGDSRVVIEGPEARIGFAQATPVGLAIHELLTNSIKFGVLSDSASNGMLRIGWSIRDDALHWEWIESGVIVDAPATLHRGFGREFIEDALPYEINAATLFEVTPEAIRCVIDLPLHGGSAGR